MTPSELFLLRYCEVYGLTYKDGKYWSASNNVMATLIGDMLVARGLIRVVQGVCEVTEQGKQYCNQ